MEERRVDTQVGPLAVRVLGQGPAAVLWHSLFVDDRSWARVENELATQRRLVIITGPGHGASGDPGRRYTLDDCAEPVDRLVRSDRFEDQVCRLSVPSVSSARSTASLGTTYTTWTCGLCDASFRSPDDRGSGGPNPADRAEAEPAVATRRRMTPSIATALFILGLRLCVHRRQTRSSSLWSRAEAPSPGHAYRPAQRPRRASYRAVACPVRLARSTRPWRRSTCRSPLLRASPVGTVTSMLTVGTYRDDCLIMPASVPVLFSSFGSGVTAHRISGAGRSRTRRGRTPPWTCRARPIARASMAAAVP